MHAEGDYSFTHIWNQWKTKPYTPFNGKAWAIKSFACFLRFVNI